MSQRYCFLLACVCLTGIFYNDRAIYWACAGKNMVLACLINFFDI